MRRSLCLAVVVLAVAAGASAQNLVFTPTTTLAAESGNNTSTAATFTTSSNNNLGAGNVSKADIRTLLYGGASTEIYVHWMPWFGTSSHINIGYDSADPTEIQKQVTDMLSRGIHGAVVDWYGPDNTHSNTAAINLMNEANLRNGEFKFAITEDGGALRSCAGSATCNLTSQIISDLTYAYNTFETSAPYLTFNGHPVVFFFDPDRYGTLDWARVASSVPGSPLFIFQNSGGFTHTQTSGSFSWVGTSSDPNNWGQSYLTTFYQTGMQFPSLHTVGSMKKGFNDTSASWGSYRVMNQNCGQTWLNTFSEIGSLYSGTNQLESVQLVTWNDYEEGTEIESGIDNCVFLGASLAGSTLKWTLVGGSESTVDHYIVFLSPDGQNLMAVAQPAVGSGTLDLAGLGVAPGTYTLYVKAVGKPTLSNKMSNPVIYTVGDQAPATTLTVTPTSGSAPLTVAASMTASDADGVITATAIDFGDGTLVAGSSATHTYAQPGQYRVAATATDNAGASSASAALVTATNQSPVAALSVSPTSGTAPVSVSANTAASYDPDGTIASSKIDFGDGTVVSGAKASHTYALAGTYTVRATVTDNFGAFNRTSKTVTIAGPAVTITAPASGSAVNSPVHVVASATSGTAISSFTVYDNGLQAYTVAASTVDTYLKLMPDEQHRLTVRATDAGGGSGQTSVTVWVADQAPVAALSVTPASGPAPLTVAASTAASTDPDGTIASSTIDFGDGTVASGPMASHAYNTAGTYTVKATVNDGLGGYASATQQVVASAAAYDLTVSPTGSGAGTVTSTPAGIDCGNTCSAIFPAGTQMTLTATPATGSIFAGWSGVCNGTGPCVLSANATNDVTATFNLASTFDFAPPPASVSVHAGQPAQFAVTVNPQNGTFANAVNFSCTAGVPPLSACSFAPPSVTPGSAPATTKLTITTTALSGTNPAVGLGAWLMLPLGLCATAMRDRKHRVVIILSIAVTMGLIGLSACGTSGTVTRHAGTPPGAYTVTVAATSGSTTRTTSVTVVVQ